MLKHGFLFFTSNKYTKVPGAVKNIQHFFMSATNMKFCTASQKEADLYPPRYTNKIIDGHSDNLTSLSTSCPHTDKFYVTEVNNKLSRTVNSSTDLQITNTPNP